RQVRGKIEVSCDDLGPQKLKNIVEPMRVWRLLRSGAAKTGTGGKPALGLPDKPSIAVLPFDNLSSDPEQGFFADGITEDVITTLSYISSLFVIARNSSFAYKGKARDLRQIGQELGVRYLL